MSRENALQIASSIQHFGRNEVSDFTATIKVFGNTYANPKAALLKEKTIKVTGCWNAKSQNVRTQVLSFIKSIKA